MKELKTLKVLEIMGIGVKPVLLYNKMVDFDINQRMEIKFRGGEIEFLNDGSNYTRHVFEKALDKARLASN
jgi:predicted RNase H-like nuclease (RuvC/YqgF family)